MSGIVSVGAAVAATAIAADAVATVGLTVGSALAITAAVGATVGAVGAITKVKELQYAGAALGAVGAIGGLAGAAGMFDLGTSLFGAAEGAGSFGASGAGELGLAGSNAGAATDAGSWAGVNVASTSTPTVAGGSAPAVETVAQQAPDVIDTINGTYQGPNTATANVPAGTPQGVTPAEASNNLANTIEQTQTQLPPYESPTPSVDMSGTDVRLPDYEGVPKFGEAPTNAPVNGDVTQPPRSSLLNGPADQPAVYNANDQLVGMPQGDSTGGTLGTTNNPAAPPEGVNTPQPVQVTGSAQQPAPDFQGIGSGSTSPMDMTPTGVPASTQQTAADFPGIGSGSTGTMNMNPPKSAWTGVMDFITKNPPLMYGAIQTAGSFISGVANPLLPAQVEELESRKRSNDAAAALALQQQQLLQRRFNNMSAPMPIASRTSLLNGGSAVTGRV